MPASSASPSSGEFLVTHTTLADRDAAQRLAHALVERRLAACVQVLGPIRSVYRWRGRVEQADEWLCAIKTSLVRYPELERAILELHPYETPEIVATPLTAGSASYLAWLRETLADDAR